VPITVANPFKGRQYPGEVILQAVRWYLRYPLAYGHVAELLAERGLAIDASCVWRWVQAYSPELNRRCQAHFKRTNKSYRLDETYIKVKGQDRYLYRAVNSTGQTIDFLLSSKRDAAAAKRFFRKVFSSPASLRPTIEGSAYGLFLSRPPVGSLLLRPADSLTVPRTVLSVGFIRFVSSVNATQATGFRLFPRWDSPPTEHASLRWSHYGPEIRRSISSTT
jgi:hypothetical protein